MARLTETTRRVDAAEYLAADPRNVAMRAHDEGVERAAEIEVEIALEDSGVELDLDETVAAIRDILERYTPCECGAATGERCGWQGPRAETALVEWMPENLRESHVQAGSWPHGAERLRVSKDCAESLLEIDEDWTTLVDVGGFVEGERVYTVGGGKDDDQGVVQKLLLDGTLLIGWDQCCSTPCPIGMLRHGTR